MDGSETTVWEYEAMLWEAGGDILNADNTKAAFNAAGGVQALDMLTSINQDGSMYLDFNPDSGKSENLFNSGNMGMFITGPWDLSSFPDANYGVQVMPSFAAGGSHETIAGPDNWVIFDNGAERVDAAWKFLSYMTSPEQVLQDSMATGHLPTRASVATMPAFAAVLQEVPRWGGLRGEPQQRHEGEAAGAAVPADLGRARPSGRHRDPGAGELPGRAEQGRATGGRVPRDPLAVTGR